MVIVSTILLHLLKQYFYVYWWCKIQYICCVFNKSCGGLCHIYSWFLSMWWWVLSLSILLSICRVYIYVRLIMSSLLYVTSTKQNKQRQTIPGNDRSTNGRSCFFRRSSAKMKYDIHDISRRRREVNSSVPDILVLILSLIHI